MSSLKRQALRATRDGLFRARRRIETMLTVDADAPRTAYVPRLREAYERGWADCPCVFVISTGRAGSKTLTALFALSSRVLAEHEPMPRLVKASFDAYLEGPAIATSDRWRDLVYAARDDLVCEANRKGRIYVETNNRMTYLAPVLARCFPASRFVHLHRHPYEVVRSGMRRGYYESHNWDFARVRPRDGEPIAPAWGALPRIEKCAWFWSRINGEADAFLATLPESRRLSLAAEDLFSGEEASLRRLFAFVGVDLPPREMLDEVLGEKINAAVRGSFPVPAEWSEADREAVWKHVGPLATRLGYKP